MSHAPPARDLVVWFVRPDVRIDRPRLTAGLDVLSNAERSRAGQFLSDAAREQFVVTRVTLRQLLSTLAPVAAAEWEFETGPHGKPHVAGPAAGRTLWFNVSHTAGLVACAASSVGPVGIDAEAVRPIPDDDAPLRLMSPDERAELAGLNGVERGRRFFAIWAAKEAYAKATGHGISDALRGITVRYAETNPRLTGLASDLPRWRLLRLDAGPGHAVVVATEHGRPPVIHWRRSGEPFPAGSA